MRLLTGRRRSDMSENGRQLWKITAIGMALVTTTAVITGIVVANWVGREADRKSAALVPIASPSPAPPAALQPAAPSTPAARPQPSPPAVSRQPAGSVPTARPQPHVSTVPTQAAIDACNRYATAQAGQHDKTTEVVKDVAIGAVAGAAVGAAGGAIAGGGKGAGKGAAIGGLLGAGGGTLYGLNENKNHDQAYREAYGACMRSHGYNS